MKKVNTRIPEITIKENTWLTVKEPSSLGPKEGATVGNAVVELGVGANVGAVVFGDGVVGAVVNGDIVVGNGVVGLVVFGDGVVGAVVNGDVVGLVVFGGIGVGAVVTFGVGLTVGLVVFGDKLGWVEFDFALLFIRVLMSLMIVVADDTTFIFFECTLCALHMNILSANNVSNKDDSRIW